MSAYAIGRALCEPSCTAPTFDQWRASMTAHESDLLRAQFLAETKQEDAYADWLRDYYLEVA